MADKINLRMIGRSVNGNTLIFDGEEAKSFVINKNQYETISTSRLYFKSGSGITTYGNSYTIRYRNASGVIVTLGTFTWDRWGSENGYEYTYIVPSNIGGVKLQDLLLTNNPYLEFVFTNANSLGNDYGYFDISVMPASTSGNYLDRKFYATDSITVDTYYSNYAYSKTTLTYDGTHRYAMVKFDMEALRTTLNQAPSNAYVLLHLCPTSSSKEPDVGIASKTWDSSSFTNDSISGTGNIIYRKVTNPSHSKDVYFTIKLNKSDLMSGNTLTLFNLYMDERAPWGAFYTHESEKAPYLTIETPSTQNYCLKGTRKDSNTVVWDSSLREFFTNTANRLDLYSENTGYIYWDSAMSYGGSVIFEYIKYRKSDGTIATITFDETSGKVTSYTHSSQTTIGLAKLPNGYTVLGLASQNKSNPYVEVRLNKALRQPETALNESLGLGQGQSGTNDIIKIEYKQPSISSTSLTKGSSEYTLNVTPNHFDKYAVTVTKLNTDGNGKNEISYEYESTSINSVVKFSYLHEGSNRIDVQVWNGNKSMTFYKVFTHYVPTISDLKIVNSGGLIDNTTSLTWKATNQAKAEIVVNNKVIATLGSVSAYIINKGVLSVGSNTIKVNVYNQADNEVVNSQTCVSSYDTVTMSRILPTISGLAISGSNIDDVLTLSCTATNYSRIDWYTGARLLGSTNTNKLTLANGTLSEGNNTFKAVVVYNSGFDTVSVQESIAKSMVCNKPIIYNLEPSGLNKNINEQIVATFETNEFCDRWELQNKAVTSKGTTERKVVYGANTFSKGSNVLTLTIYYSPAWSNGAVVRTATKTVTFNGYGKPELPNLLIKEIYSTSSPTVEWSMDEEQVGFEYIVTKKGEIVIQEEKTSTENKVQLMGLEDKTEYVFSLRLKNRYGLYSDLITTSFSTLFSEILIPDFYLVEMENSVQITINGYQESTFKSISIYRRTPFSDWLEIADNCNVEDTVIDGTCPCNIEAEYKIRVFNTDNAYKDSEPKTVTISLMNYWLTNVENFKESYRMDFVKTSQAFNSNVVFKMYTGQASPTAFKGKMNYTTTSLQVELENSEMEAFINFIDTSNDYNLFCYKNWKGEKKFVVAIIESVEPVNSQMVQISLNLTEVNFIERKMYSGHGFRKIVYLNGEYALDGSIDLTGYDDNYVIQKV